MLEGGGGRGVQIFIDGKTDGRMDRWDKLYIYIASTCFSRYENEKIKVLSRKGHNHRTEPPKALENGLCA